MFEIKNGQLNRYTGSEAEISIPYGTESICDSAFEWCEELEKVIIPEGVKHIGDDAFYGCKKLKYISLPETLISIGNRTFSGCSSLFNINLNENIEVIGEGAFEWCGIKDIILPSKIRIICRNTFKKCRNLRKITVNQNCIQFEANAFSGCSNLTDIKIPEKLQVIGSECFKSCSALKEIELPPSTETIGKGAFEDCAALEKIVLPEGFTVIPDNLFAACAALSEITLNSSITKIGSNAFRRCAALRKLTIPSSVTEIGSNAFSGCSKIQIRFQTAPAKVGKMIVPDTKIDVTNGTSEMYCTSFLTKNEIKSCPEIDIPESVTKLYSGFNCLLSYDEKLLDKTCYTHILHLKKYACKVFIGEKYYPDDLIFETAFDFNAYDKMFSLAFNSERHIISAYRLAYPVNLSEEKRKLYSSCLDGNEEAAALFAIKKNDRILLRYILSSFDATEIFADIMYDEAKKEKHFELLSIITSLAKNNEFDLFSFDDEPSDNGNWLYRLTQDDKIIITGYRGNALTVRYPNTLDGMTVAAISDNFVSAAKRTIVPDGLYFSGSVQGDVYYEYCNAHIFIPDIKDIVCKSYILDGIKYFDFDAFDRSLISCTGKGRLKAVMSRLLSPVNISEENKIAFLDIIRDTQQMTSEESRLYSQFSENTEKTTFTDEYKTCFGIPDSNVIITDSADYELNENGVLISCRLKNNVQALTLPPFIKTIGAGAFKNIELCELRIPSAAIKTEDGVFNNVRIKHITFCERTELSHTLFTENSSLETVTIINNDGEEDTVYYPKCKYEKDAERLAFIFIYRNPKIKVNIFSYFDYDKVEAIEADAIKRAYYRIGSVNRPENGKYLEYANIVYNEMKKNNDTVRIRNGVRNGYIKD